MRVLSEEEMDEVFGGQATETVVPTLGTVHVTASRMNSNGGGFWMDGGSGFGNYDEDTGSSGGCYYNNYPHPALPSAQVPSPEKLLCVMDAVAVPGNDLRTDFRFAVVNSYGYYNPTTEAMYLYSNPVTPNPGYISINGLTVATNWSSSYHGTSSIFAGSMDGSNGQNAVYGSHYNDAGQLVNSYALGVLSGIEEAILTTAHEARHQYTIWNPSLLGSRDQEADARTYAIEALENYRAGAGHDCN